MSSEPKILTLKINLLGYDTLCLGINTETLGNDIKQYTFLVKFSGDEPKSLEVKSQNLASKSEVLTEKVKVFTFGLFMITKESRIRAGFIKRRQILIKA